jgi:CRISP-associated protein Cas1
MQLLNTLYITTPETYLRLDNDTLRVEVDQETRLRLPLHHLHAVVCFGHAGLSTPLIHRLADEGIALVLLDDNGRFKARIEGAVSGNVLLRQAQHRQAGDAAFALGMARNCVAGKVKNSRQLLMRGAREAKSDADVSALTRCADDLAATLRALPAAAPVHLERFTLLGANHQVQSAKVLARRFAGEAARQYFGGLNLVVRAEQREAFQMDGRSRRPPRDRMNALLSFLYALWMNDCRSALEAAGLDPQVGFLHALRPGRAALALDLMEEFRPLADRLALTLINRSQLQPADFMVREGGGVSLTGDSRKAVLVAYQERKREELKHPLLAQNLALGVVPLVQARLMARAIRGDGVAALTSPGYLPFIVK